MRNATVTVQNVVTYDVVVGVDNTDLRLKPGMTANVTITTANRADAIRVPTSALRFRPPADAGSGSGTVAAAGATADGGRRVWGLDDGTPRAVPVKIGIADDRFTEVLDGLASGDRVIVALRREATQPTAGTLPSFAPTAPRGGRSMR